MQFSRYICAKEIFVKFSGKSICKFKLRLRSFSLTVSTRLRLGSYFALLVFTKYSGSGDGEIRTLDPLLARQVLSQLSYTPIKLASTYSPIPSPV